MNRETLAHPMRMTHRDFDFPHPQRPSQLSSAPVTTQTGYVREATSPVVKPNGKPANLGGAYDEGACGCGQLFARKG